MIRCPLEIRMANRLTAPIVVLATLVSIHGVTNAQPAPAKPDIAAAKKAFRDGQKLLREKAYGKAIVQFRKAHGITKDDLVMGQIALAYDKAGDYKAALKAITLYRAALPRSDRRPVDRLIRRYKRRIRAGRSKRLALPTAQPPKRQAPPKVRRLAEPTKTKKPKPKQLDEIEEPKRNRFWTWIAVGGTGAFAVTALALGLSAQSEFDELSDRCGPSTSGRCAQGDIDGVKTRAIASDIFWGLTGAAAVTATVLFFWEGGYFSGERNTRPKNNDDVVQNMRVAPLVSGSFVGLGAQFRY